MSDPQLSADEFLCRYDESELRIASEFLSNWLPFLSKDLCHHCTFTLSHRIHSLSPLNDDSKECSKSGESWIILMPDDECKDVYNCDSHSLGSWKDEGETNSCGANANGWLESSIVGGSPRELSNSVVSVKTETPRVRLSWADMAQEDELEGVGESKVEENGGERNGDLCEVATRKTELSRDQREYLRFMNVRRKKDYICLERVDGKVKNILQGLELHTGVFSAVEQRRIVDYVYDLVEKGKRGELKERTYTAPRKWMKGKGRVTIQFGCCYNYAVDKMGNPPGILKRDEVDPLPSLFKVIIKRLIRWHVLPPSCVPDSCIVNIYEEGDCIPPHIDNHDFVRPFCTISFLSECNIVFGRDLKIEGPGEFSGCIAIPLPVGSVMVLNGNGADVAKHCVPAVPSKRISITFRKMDESKRPVYFAYQPDLQGLEPLCYDKEGAKKSPSPPHVHKQGTRGGFTVERKRSEEPRYSARNRVGMSGPRTRVNF
ncbi:RNA demethylase ALKBH9B isoform X2 [Beta vulgaris subsp. vulgaris]|uniref:RNA demethylase ALKBH9B isoform X2 n=1 Tax=Beta vulgaris subsp. vulgaris TaxID=3555 RepID=UPI002036F951|nr:RNA demethylase ALKBH9B isoform X2 [Beta vulgaris subsp. vulgaris]